MPPGLAIPSSRAAMLTPSPHQIAVALLDHVAQMNADAELDATLGRKADVALDHAVLHLNRAAHGVDHAAELDEAAVAGALDDAPVMRLDGGIPRRESSATRENPSHPKRKTRPMWRRNSNCDSPA